jgi:hypothetical protein
MQVAQPGDEAVRLRGDLVRSVERSSVKGTVQRRGRRSLVKPRAPLGAGRLRREAHRHDVLFKPKDRSYAAKPHDALRERDSDAARRNVDGHRSPSERLWSPLKTRRRMPRAVFVRSSHACSAIEQPYPLWTA